MRRDALRCALRSRAQGGGDDWLRITARQRGLPLYAIKTDALSQLARSPLGRSLPRPPLLISPSFKSSTRRLLRPPATASPV